MPYCVNAYSEYKALRKQGVVDDIVMPDGVSSWSDEEAIASFVAIVLTQFPLRAFAHIATSLHVHALPRARPACVIALLFGFRRNNC